MTTAIDLWGDLPDDNLITPPSAILQRQAVLLSKKTGGKLVGSVVSTRTGDDTMAFHFEVVAPFLNDYSFRIISFRHPITLYPVTVLDRVNGGGAHIYEDEESFIEAVGEILASDKVRKVLASLLSQAAHQE